MLIPGSFFSSSVEALFSFTKLFREGMFKIQKFKTKYKISETTREILQMLS